MELLERRSGELQRGSMPHVYTWPTAVVSVKDVYHVTTTSDGGDTLPFALEVWVGGENGVID